jgi:hypothetical protein
MCYWQCNGDKLQYCGGEARIDIYNNRRLAQLTSPSVQKASGTHRYKGCYTELDQERALANGGTVMDLMMRTITASSAWERL